MPTEAQLKRVFEEKSGKMKTALLLSASQAIRTPGSRFTVFIFSIYPTKEFCHCRWHRGAPQIYLGNSQIRKRRKATDFRPLQRFCTGMSRRDSTITAIGNGSSAFIWLIFQLYHFHSVSYAKESMNHPLCPCLYLSLPRSRTRWFDVKETLQCTLVRSEEVMWVIY